MNMFEIKSKIKQLKNTVLQMTPLEIKVRECTSNDAWGVKLSDKLEVADHTYNYEDFKLIMSVIRIRLADVGKDWRHVQKGIQLVEFLVINGSDRCHDEAKDMQSLIRHLKNFKYVDDEGKDWGVNVRDSAKHFLEFIKDEEKIKEEREAAKQQKDKYSGFSRSEAKYKRPTSSSTSEKKKEKKPTKQEYDDDYDAPKKSTSRSSFEEDQDSEDKEEESRYSTKQTSATTSTTTGTRPRKPSTGPTPSFTTTTTQPIKQKEDTLIDFFDTPVVPATTQYVNTNNNGFGNNNNNNGWNTQPTTVNNGGGFNPRSNNTVQPSSGGFNPRSNNTANTASFGGNDFDANFDSSGFDDGFGETNDAFNNMPQEKKDSTLFDISSGLVNLDLNESAKKQNTVPTNSTQPSTNMTLKELKRLQGNNTPSKQPVMNNSSTSFQSPPRSNYPPQNNFGNNGGFPPQNNFGNGGYPPQNNQQWNNQPPVNNNFGNGGYPPQNNQQWNNQPPVNRQPPQNNNGGGFDFF